MPVPPRLAALALAVFALAGAGCSVAIPFEDRPAHDYVYKSGVPLRVALLDETGTAAWVPAIDVASGAFDAAAPLLDLDASVSEANIVITIRRYIDAAPPVLDGYRFQPGVGGFAAVYDSEGRACNFPPSPLPLNCDGEIARADIYLNDGLPPGPDLEARRERLVRHELGHALGLTRHSPEVDASGLAARYGW